MRFCPRFPIECVPFLVETGEQPQRSLRHHHLLHLRHALLQRNSELPPSHLPSSQTCKIAGKGVRSGKIFAGPVRV